MKTALLVIDMQEFFREMTTHALPNVLKLLHHFDRPSSSSSPKSNNDNNTSIIFTQHGHTKAELTPPFKNQLVKKWGPSGSIAVGSPDWEIMTELRDFGGGDDKRSSEKRRMPSTTTTGNTGNIAEKENFFRFPIVAKNTYDAFINTDLAETLGSRGVERVVVCGVMTDCCCDTTARSAFNRGFETWLVGDACGSANGRQHEAGLRGFGFAFGEVVDVEEVMGRV